jgi:membrane protein implicated in regulation of membrane protease activity
MEYWFWIIIGIGFLALEIFVSTGFYLFIIGVAAIGVGLLALAGLATSWIAQSALFCVLAILFWILFADRLQKLLRSGEKEYQGVVGQVVKAIENIAPGHKGAGELWGAPWRLENMSDAIIPADTECIVVSSDGIILQVKPK